MFNFNHILLADFLNTKNITNYKENNKFKIESENFIVKLFTYIAIILVGAVLIESHLDIFEELPNLAKIILATLSIFSIKQIIIDSKYKDSFSYIAFDCFRKLTILFSLVLGSWGIFEFLDSIMKVNSFLFPVVALLIFNLLFFWQVKSFIFRALSSSALVTSVAFYFLEFIIKQFPPVVNAHMLAIGIIFIVALALYIEFSKVHYKYSQYFGLIFTMVSLVLLALCYYSRASLFSKLSELPMNTFMGCFIALNLALVYFTASKSFKNLKALNNHYYMASALIIIGLIVLSNQFIILLVLLALLSYQYVNNAMLVLMLMALPCSIIHYYYNLDVTLMEKSIILMVSGLAILIVRFLLIKGSKTND